MDLNMTYKQREEMKRKYVEGYDKSMLGAARNPGMRAQAVQPAQGAQVQKRSRFDALIRRRRS